MKPNSRIAPGGDGYVPFVVEDGKTQIEEAGANMRSHGKKDVYGDQLSGTGSVKTPGLMGGWGGGD